MERRIHWNETSDSEWVLLETLCAVLYEDKLVPFQTCAAWDSGFFRHCQVLHTCDNYTTEQFCKPTELLTMPSPVVNPFLWWSVSGLRLNIACSTSQLRSTSQTKVFQVTPSASFQHGYNFITRRARHLFWDTMHE